MRFIAEAKRDNRMVAVGLGVTILLAILIIWTMSYDLGGSSASSDFTEIRERCSTEHMTVEDKKRCEHCRGSSCNTASTVWFGATLLLLAFTFLTLYSIYILFRVTPPRPSEMTHTLPPPTEKIEPSPRMVDICPCHRNPNKSCTFTGVISSTVDVKTTEIPLNKI